MKKIFLLLIATVVAMSSFARVNHGNNQLTNSPVGTEMMTFQDNNEGVSIKAPSLNDVPEVITQQPAGELRTYERNTYSVYWGFSGWTASYTQGEINVVLNGDKAYIQNPLYYYSNYNTWVEGDYDSATGIITVPTGQYLTYFPEFDYGIQLVWGTTYFYEENGGYYLTDEVYTDVETIRFQIVGANLYLLDSEGDVDAEFPYFYNTVGMTASYDDDVFVLATECVMGPGEPIGIGTEPIEPATPAIPANPVALSWFDSGEEDGSSAFYFTLPTTDLDGNDLNMQNVSYRIYLDDDQLFTFDADTYWFDLFDDMTEVPYWLWSDGMDFFEGAVFFYRTNEGDNPLFTWRIGIQAGYTVDGVTNYSDIIYLEVFPQTDPTGLNEMTSGKSIAGVRYFNMAGQEMQQPSGLTIMVTTYTDGTSSAVKVVK